MPLSSDLSETRIVPDSPAVKPCLDDLQGNILKGHGRDHTISVFFHFQPGKQVKAKAWLAAFTKRFVPSATKQLADTARFKKEGLPGGTFLNVFLTNKCYEYLAIPDAKRPTDKKFKDGMIASNQDPASPFSPAVKLPLNDSPTSEWEAGYDGLIHVMVLIADDNPYFVRAMKRAVIMSLDGIATIMREQAGRVIRNADGNGIEHNGYADGVSQPLFLKDDIDKEAARIGHHNWNPEAPLNLALVRDKGGKTPDSCGSYFVFRKIEQNVQAFKAKEKQLATFLFGPNHTDEHGELAGAMVVGRHENGTPLMLQQNAVAAMPKDHIPNDYTFDTPNNDGDARCPFHAHTRKNNPRSDAAGVEENKTHRIIRRGIPFEDVPRPRVEGGLLDEDVEPTGKVGLLFMCFQANIFNQFEFIQRVWANNEDFPEAQTGIGPIVGSTPHPIPQSWPVDYNSTTKKQFLFNDVTKMKGGAYFFAPSLSFLKGLSTATAIPAPLQIFADLDAFLIS